MGKRQNESVRNPSEFRDAKGRYKSGFHHNPAGEFKLGEHANPAAEFKPGNIPKHPFKPGGHPNPAGEFKPGIRNNPAGEILPGERRGLVTEIAPGEHRSPATEFKPGQSGNPKGRPRLTDEQKETLEKIRALAPRAEEVLEEILNDKTVAAIVRLKAVEMILDRTYGKAPAKVDLVDPRASAQEARARLESIFTRAVIRGRESREAEEVQAVVVDVEPDRKGEES